MRNFNELPLTFWNNLAEFADLNALIMLSLSNQNNRMQTASFCPWHIIAKTNFAPELVTAITAGMEDNAINWHNIVQVLNTQDYSDKKIYGSPNNSIILQITYYICQNDIENLDRLCNTPGLTLPFDIIYNSLLKFASDKPHVLQYFYNHFERWHGPHDENLSRLHWAIYCKQPMTTIESLVEGGANLHDNRVLVQSELHLTPFGLAIKTGYLAAARYLSDKDASVMHRTEPGMNFLMLAICYKQQECVHFLLQYLPHDIIVDFDENDYHSRINMQNCFGRDKSKQPLHESSALDYAWQIGYLPVINTLIAAGATSNQERYRMTPMHIAAQYTQMEAIKQLINTNPEYINQRNFHGYTPLKLFFDNLDYANISQCQANKIVEIYQLFRNNGLEIDSLRDNQLLISAICIGKVEIVHDLIKKRIPFDISTHYYETPGLHRAVLYNRPEVAAYLINLYSKNDPEWCARKFHDRHGRSPIHYVPFKNTHAAIIRLLIQNGDDPSQFLTPDNQATNPALYQKIENFVAADSEHWVNVVSYFNKR